MFINIVNLAKLASPSDHMIKFDLTNSSFHISLHHKTRGLFRIKCQNKYYVINKLPQGLSVSPYIMQRVMSSLLQTMLKKMLTLKHISTSTTSCIWVNPRSWRKLNSNSMRPLFSLMKRNASLNPLV